MPHFPFTPTKDSFEFYTATKETKVYTGYFDRKFLTAENLTTENPLSVAFEVHCARVITQNDAVRVPVPDDWLSLD